MILPTIHSLRIQLLQSRNHSYVGGGAFYIENFTGDVAHNTFTQNSSTHNWTSTYNGGGAFYIQNFTGDIARNTFTANEVKEETADDRFPPGAGFYVYRFTGNVVNNTFTQNSAQGAGGGFWIAALAGNITHNIFDGNSGRWAGAFDLASSSNTVEVSNNIFFNNTSTDTGDAIVTRHATHIMNNLFMISDELSGGCVRRCYRLGKFTRNPFPQ